MRVTAPVQIRLARAEDYIWHDYRSFVDNRRLADHDSNRVWNNGSARYACHRVDVRAIQKPAQNLDHTPKRLQAMST